MGRRKPDDESDERSPMLTEAAGCGQQVSIASGLGMKNYIILHALVSVNRGHSPRRHPRGF